jgi:hypothetical protein
MIRFLLPALVIALLATMANANDVYRTVQRDGTVVYSDRPLSPESVRVNVSSDPTDPERVAAEASARQAAEAERRSQAAEDEALAEGLAEGLAAQAELRAKACSDARKAHETYDQARRLYEPLPDGGRRYLSDEEVVRARESARQAVADFCDD